jgi:hypothetical protein
MLPNVGSLPNGPRAQKLWPLISELKPLHKASYSQYSLSAMNLYLNYKTVTSVNVFLLKITTSKPFWDEELTG